MKALLIVTVPTLEGNPFTTSGMKVGLPCRSLHEASIVIIKTDKYFRCIKNRWATPDNDEKIPIGLLFNYIWSFKNQLVDIYMAEIELDVQEEVKKIIEEQLKESLMR